MAQAPIEELLKRGGGLYKLVLLAAKRAKEVSEGAVPLVETAQRKATSIALEEIVQGKVLYKTQEPEARPGRKGRGAKAKEERKKR